MSNTIALLRARIAILKEALEWNRKYPGPNKRSAAEIQAEIDEYELVIQFIQDI